MDMKNTTILLIFLLCIIGLIAGIYYNEASESTATLNNFEEVVHEDPNGTITIQMEVKENENALNKFFT